MPLRRSGNVRGACPSDLCFVAPRLTTLELSMILSLRPGTRQDPLKNSSGLLAALGGSQSLGAFDKLLRKLATRLGRLLEGGVGLEPTCSGLQPDVYPFGHPPFVAGRAPPVKQTFHLNSSLRSPCTSLSCTSRRRRRLSVLRCRCTSCRLPPFTGGILFRRIPGRLQAHSHARPWRSLLSSGHITKLMMPAMLAVTN